MKCNTDKGNKLPEEFSAYLEKRIEKYKGNDQTTVNTWKLILDNNNTLIERITPFREDLLKSAPYKPVLKGKPTVKQRREAAEKQQKIKVVAQDDPPDLEPFDVWLNKYNALPEPNFHIA